MTTNDIGANTNLQLDLELFTCGLLKYFPLNIKSMILAGELLFDAYYTLIKQKRSTYNFAELKEINLVLIGNPDDKKSNALQVISNIKNTYGNKVIVGVNKCVICIFIIGVPRIIKLICSGYSKPQELIDNFDIANSGMYWSNEGFYISPFAKFANDIGQVLPNPQCGTRAKLHNLINYKKKGLDLSEYIKEYPFNYVNYSMIQAKFVQKKAYMINKNLTGLRPRYHKGFLQNAFQIKDFDSENFDWDGKLQLLQKESFIGTDFQLDRHRDKHGELNDYIHQTPINLTQPGLYRDLLIKGTITHVKKGDIRVGPFICLAVSDPDSIKLIKNISEFATKQIKIGINNYDDKQYETCILNSRALTPLEAELFNVECSLFKNGEQNPEIKSFADSNNLHLYISVRQDECFFHDLKTNNEEQMFFSPEYLAANLNKEVIVALTVHNNMSRYQTVYKTVFKLVTIL